LQRLKEIVALRERERARLESVRRMQQTVLEAEALLAGAALPPEQQSNPVLGERFDRWCAELAGRSLAEGVAPKERDCLAHFIAVTARLRPHLLECYRVQAIPRTNNDMAGFIRRVKIRYRWISGRKNWNRYLLRYGRRIVFYEPVGAANAAPAGTDPRMNGVERSRWRAARAEQRQRETEQLQQYRFRRQRAAFLAKLEARWAVANSGTGLLP
jgi:hypothetical protein